MLLRTLVAALLLLAACAEPEAPRGPSPAEQERRREADIADERARMARANQEEADAEARHRADHEARELAAKREAFTRRQAATEKAIADAAPCVTKSTETEAERARWDGAKWVEEKCGLYRTPPLVACNPVCIRTTPCPVYLCPVGTDQGWIDLANQKVCGGASEGQRAMLVDTPPPCATLGGR